MEKLELICILSFFVGIAFLLLFYYDLESNLKDICSISEKDIGEYVVINGKVKNFFKHNETCFFQIENKEKCKIKGVIFNCKYSKIEGFRKIEGEIKKYRGNLEIIVKKIE